jgi:Zn-dependent metalloprotease
MENTLENLIKQALKEAKRPDYPDVDGDGDRKEPMAKAFKDKKLKDKKLKGKITKKPKRKKIKEEEIAAGESNTMFNIKVDVSNKQSETKLGIRIQLEPKEGFLEPELQDKLEIAISKKLNNALEQFDMQVSKDTDVPDPTIIGFFIPLSQIKNMIVKSLGGSTQTEPTTPSTSTPAVKPSVPLAPTSSVIDDVEEMINEELIREMRVRELKEISRVVSKDDFYEFINKGNNILRTLEESGLQNGKKYLEYLVKHNIM